MQLRDNPNLKANYNKYNHGSHGANNSMVPDQMYSQFQTNFNSGKIDIKHIENIDYLTDLHLDATQ